MWESSRHGGGREEREEVQASAGLGGAEKTKSSIDNPRRFEPASEASEEAKRHFNTIYEYNHVDS